MVFDWPGIGAMFVDSIGTRDFPIIQAIVGLVAVSVLAANLIVDLLYGVVDPRIRLARRVRYGNDRMSRTRHHPSKPATASAGAGPHGAGTARADGVAGRRWPRDLGRAAAERMAKPRRLPLLPLFVIARSSSIAIFGEWLAPLAAQRAEPPAALPALPPGSRRGNIRYLLGTDNLGRDVLSRIIVGARAVLHRGNGRARFRIGAGLPHRARRGLFRRPLRCGRHAHRRRHDGLPAGPGWRCCWSAVIGPGVHTVVIATSLILWARFARLIRSEVLSVRERDFVTLARIAGASSRRIMLVHILPNVLNSVVVLLTLQLGFRHHRRSDAQLPGRRRAAAHPDLGPDGGRRPDLHRDRLVDLALSAELVAGGLTNREHRGVPESFTSHHRRTPQAHLPQAGHSLTRRARGAGPSASLAGHRSQPSRATNVGRPPFTGCQSASAMPA